MLKNAGSSAKREEIERVCGWEKQKTTGILNELIKLGLVKRQGGSKATYYKLSTDCRFKDDEEKVNSAVTISKPHPVNVNEVVSDLLLKLKEKGIEKSYMIKLTYVELVPLDA